MYQLQIKESFAYRETIDKRKDIVRGYRLHEKALQRSFKNFLFLFKILCCNAKKIKNYNLCVF